MRAIVLISLIVFASCSEKIPAKKENPMNYIQLLDEVWNTEQSPISKRDSLIEIYGVEHELVKKQQIIYQKNHAVNEQKVLAILDEHGWPSNEMIGEQGNWTICNVLQHSSHEIRVKYYPLMEKATKEGKLEARFLVRAADRIATDLGKLQIYGGQMKFYPETKSFNVWPVYDPVNIDKRRAEIGLEPIAEFLKNRFDFDWNLEEQIIRSEAFERERLTENH